MPHAQKVRRLQGSPAKREAVLRSIVSSLLHHEAIKTTLARAKITARVAEKIITMGKIGTVEQRRKAEGFLRPPHISLEAITAINSKTPPTQPLKLSDPSIDPASLENFLPPKSLLPKVFDVLAERYRDRPGGYTRIHKYGKRKGDNAPHAIVTLVDGPRDIKFELLAKIVGADVARAQLQPKAVAAPVVRGKSAKTTKETKAVQGDLAVQSGGLAVQSDLDAGPAVGEESSGLSNEEKAIRGDLEEWMGGKVPTIIGKTRQQLKQVLKFRGKEDVAEFEVKARHYADLIAAEGSIFKEAKPTKVALPSARIDKTRRIPRSKTYGPYGDNTEREPGQRLHGMSMATTGLGLARGVLGKIQPFKLQKEARLKTAALLDQAGDVFPASTRR